MEQKPVTQRQLIKFTNTSAISSGQEKSQVAEIFNANGGDVYLTHIFMSYTNSAYRDLEVDFEVKGRENFKIFGANNAYMAGVGTLENSNQSRSNINVGRVLWKKGDSIKMYLRTINMGTPSAIAAGAILGEFTVERAE
ncbi:MAG: hypothetical protein KDH96_01775 [Candidatus Riesia sp.]|nr:hypothetical protein [Candidatus Riesia sp.]